MGKVLSILAIALIAGCASGKFFESVDADSLKRWEYKDCGFFVDFPVLWDVRKLPTMVFAASPKQGFDDSFRENVNIFVQELSGNSDPEIFLEQAIAKQQQKSSCFELLQRGHMSIDGISASWFSGVYALNGLKVKILQYFACKGNRLYIIGYGAEENRYSDYKAIFDSIVGSIHFLP